MTTVKQMSLSAAFWIKCAFDGSSYLMKNDDTSVNWSTLAWTLLYIKIQVEA
jgi:hypothetical protein